MLHRHGDVASVYARKKLQPLLKDVYESIEEKWTAWVDGQLSGRELFEFEASLPDKAAAEAERTGALKLGELLEAELSARH